ncbi:unnamed protein product [Caenorhabditis angaria]|uniref:Uncharacterized protein n=1 Tax=Caenorhabditis angaria TaxID=860376 RepID=A0A9P1ISQ0_9PELO|nr:unnamed protein product [Caenorhabditis angaria]
MSMNLEYSDAFVEEITKKCTHFIGPLRIPKRIPPKNYKRILNVLQTYSSVVDLNNNWIRLITDQFNQEDIEFQNDRLMTTYVANHKTRWMFFSMFFTILTMMFIYFFFSISKEFSERVAKFIRFRKYYLGYTIIPVFCCIMIISMTVSFGKEATKAEMAIRNARSWWKTALTRNEYVRKESWEEVDCSTVLPPMDDSQKIEYETQIFGFSSEEINRAIVKYTNRPANYDLTQLPIKAVLKLYKIHNIHIFTETEIIIDRTYDLLRIPGENLINTAKYSIFVVSTISICFTSFICLMVFLDLQNKYPIILTLIQLFSPILLFFIIIGFVFIWYIFTSIVASYTVYSHLIHPEIHQNIKFKRAHTLLFFQSLATHENFDMVNETYAQFNETNLSIFDVYPRDVIHELLKKTNETSAENYRSFFIDCYKNESKCTYKSKDLILKSDELFLIEALHAHEFGVSAISYLRYLSFFKQNTFVPIASLVWEILPLPALIFFNLIFIHFATPLIRKKSDETSSDGFM